MPITAEHAGRSYPPTAPYQVSRAKIAEFAEAVGEHPSPVADGAEPAAPPTFAVVVAAQAWEKLFGDPELGLDLSRTMHTDQGFRWQRPLRAGDEVTATLRIERVRQRGGTEIISTAIDIATTGDEPVCTATGTFLHSREER